MPSHPGSRLAAAWHVKPDKETVRRVNIPNNFAKTHPLR